MSEKHEFTRFARSGRGEGHCCDKPESDPIHSVPAAAPEAEKHQKHPWNCRCLSCMTPLSEHLQQVSAASSPAPVAPAEEGKLQQALADFVASDPCPNCLAPRTAPAPAEPVSEPLPCPWCGETKLTIAQHEGSNPMKWIVCCDAMNCRVGPCTDSCDTREEAVALWNQRAK